MVSVLLGVIQGGSRIFIWGGGGAKDYIARTHITSAKSEVPFGRDPGPGPLSGPWKLYRDF